MNKRKFVKWFPLSLFLLAYQKLRHLSDEQMREWANDLGKRANWPYDNPSEERKHE